MIGVAIVLGTMLGSVRLSDSDHCWLWFQWLIWLTGDVFSSGLLVEYLLRQQGLEKRI